MIRIAAIEACRVPRKTAVSGNIDLRLSEALPLIEGLAGSTRALPVRQLLHALGFDEHRHLRWRMEHKLIQATVLSHWIPEAIPRTYGLGERHRADTFPHGRVIKPTLGDSSGEQPDRDSKILREVEAAGMQAAATAEEEAYIVQERIEIAAEYRVHSIEDDIIPDLTFRRYDAGSLDNERDAPNAFVKQILTRLPDALVGGTLYAWDIALQPSGEFKIIEVNFSGFHPVFKRGFHCSGYFHDQNWGACDTARLLNFVAKANGIEVNVIADTPDHPIENRFYTEVANWQLRHKGVHAVLSPREYDLRAEDTLLQPLLNDIEEFAAPRHREPVNGEIELRLSAAMPLLPQLAASSRALLLRQVLLSLGFDEIRLTTWRLEHKLVQALVFRHYNADSLPFTTGFDRLTQGISLCDLRPFLKSRFQAGFIIKTALGDCSGSDIDDRTEAALAYIESGSRYNPGPGSLSDEEFIVQERKPIQHEYRIHTIEDGVVTGLTVHRHHGFVAPGEREGPNDYVQRMLDSLPAAITSGSHLAWDVARLTDGSFATIEVNIGGLHTKWNPGFHSSGFYHHKGYGAIYTARLLLFAEQTYNCHITVIPDAPEHFDEQFFYSEVADWKSRFTPASQQ